MFRGSTTSSSTKCVSYLRANIFTAKQADSESKEANYSSLHQKAALTGMDAKMTEVVPHRLPHTGHPVSEDPSRETHHCESHQGHCVIKYCVGLEYLPVLQNNTQHHLQTEGSIFFIVSLFIWGDRDQSLKREMQF